MSRTSPDWPLSVPVVARVPRCGTVGPQNRHSGTQRPNPVGLACVCWMAAGWAWLAAGATTPTVVLTVCAATLAALCPKEARRG